MEVKFFMFLYMHLLRLEKIHLKKLSLIFLPLFLTFGI